MKNKDKMLMESRGWVKRRIKNIASSSHVLRRNGNEW